MAPENYLEKIVKTQPETVLFIDAINFNGDPGEVRIFNPEEIAAGGLSTSDTRAPRRTLYWPRALHLAVT